MITTQIKLILLRVGRMARELCARDDRRRPAAENGDAVPALLAFSTLPRSPHPGSRRQETQHRWSSPPAGRQRQASPGAATRATLLMLKLAIFMRVPVI